MTALKKAYAEIILNTAKEAAARIMVSEKKALRFQQELFSTKEEALRMLLRLKQMLDSKVWWFLLKWGYFLILSCFDFLSVDVAMGICGLVLFWLCFVMWVWSESSFVEESSDLYKTFVGILF